MRDKLRRRYQTQKEVARNGYFEGEITISELERLDDLLYHGTSGGDGSIFVRFEFVRNELGAAKLVGNLSGSLELECQR